jgi:hypothetical protein
MLPTDIRGDDRVASRFLLAVLSAAFVTSTAWAKEASPQMVECHDYATKKYIADFRQVSGVRISLDDGVPTVVAAFQNDSLRYEDYLAECLKRSDSEKPK